MNRLPTRLRMATLAAVLLLAAACSPDVPRSNRPGAESASPPAPAPSSEPPASTPDPSFEALVAEGIQVRTMLGLRADEEWVRAVSSDPGARTNFGVPLTVAEEATLSTRGAWREELAPILEQYAEEHRDEFAGMLIDQEADGALVVLFTGHLEEHAAAIARLVRPGAPIEVRLAPMSEHDLEGLMLRITQDGALLRSVGVAVVTASADEQAGRVTVEVSTERGDVQALLAARYGPMVDVRVLDPTGAYVKPAGSIAGRVVDRDGNGVPAMIGSVPLFAELPLDAVGPPETNADGSFRLDQVLPGRWRVSALSDDFEQVSVDVDVPPGGVATVELVVDPGS